MYGVSGYNIHYVIAADRICFSIIFFIFFAAPLSEWCMNGVFDVIWLIIYVFIT